MRYLYTILILIVSFSMSAQTVGQEYLPNPGICTTQNTAAGCDTTGVDGAGTINAENLYGVSAFSGVVTHLQVQETEKHIMVTDFTSYLNLVMPHNHNLLL